MIDDPQRPVKERVGAGNALSIFGDPRDFDELLPVPAGEFLMGSKADEKDAYDDEKPQHIMQVDAFRIGKYPVTNAQYARFVAATDREPPQHWRGKEPPSELRNHPVVNVSWRDAWVYCQWLSEEKGETYRLPSEAEWEKAARGTEGLIYPWGDDFDAGKCNMGDTGINATSPVGMFAAGASPYECLDMSGNVWEWTMTKWINDYQNYKPNDDPKGNESRVLRGGAFFDLVRQLVRCAARDLYDPDFRLNYLGFRVVAPGL